MAQRRWCNSGQNLSGLKSTDCTFLQNYFGNRELRNILPKKVKKYFLWLQNLTAPTAIVTQLFPSPNDKSYFASRVSLGLYLYNQAGLLYRSATVGAVLAGVL